MTLYQFNRLDELEQLETVWEHGALVAERDDVVNRYKLYQIDSFYVEEEWHWSDDQQRRNSLLR